ncbi:3-mercaptopyruvate sulfurtransferase [Sphingomonas ginkgonis]|uniref:Sulfurtransferase n=1 Tax=Sphingomonas ginkgonis TaxID=2315330 RepID=A0A3R9YL45_9SPHN|nr:3-mercaptopyruvate sulfurtransferase [Sphingomonas ginkgonis]RST30239.1 3-mercaptopyruvate sulfurtransferase [Sphingomonas ginkgonis]
MDDLVSTAWLASELGAPDLTILDATYFLPDAGRSARDEYDRRHIPGARFFDIEAIVDHDQIYPHMLPDAPCFGQAMRDLGVGQDDRIIVYDNSPLRTAVRAWFMLRHFGAPHVALLDGGLAKWVAEGRPTDGGEPAGREALFDAEARQGDTVTKEEVAHGLGLPLVDARSQPRFEGSEKDPRPGVAAGHIPGARNLPYAACYRPDGTFKRDSELEEVFAAAGVDPRQPFIASCGSGVTANSLVFAAHLLGNDRVRLYDGSWSEWGADPRSEKELGPAR